MNLQIQVDHNHQPIRLTKHAYLPQQQPLPNKPIDSSSNNPIPIPTVEQSKAKAEQKLAPSTEMEMSSEQIYRDHRSFLESYKRQRELELGRREREEVRPKRSVSTVQYQPSGSGVSERVLGEVLGGIHAKISREILEQGGSEERPFFKLFRETVQNKNDILRVSKERRFMRSQLSQNCEYREPAMPPKSRLPLELRVRTEQIYDEVELSRQARDFIERVQKQQENLLGKHLLRKKKEERKRSKQELLEYNRVIEEAEAKREERKLKAQRNLQLIKEKARLTKLVGGRPFEEEGQEREVRNFRYSLKQEQHSQHSTHHHPKHTALQKYQELSQIATDRINTLNPPALNIKDKIAIRKRKVVKTTQYRQTTDLTQTEEDSIKERERSEAVEPQTAKQSIFGEGELQVKPCSPIYCGSEDEGSLPGGNRQGSSQRKRRVVTQV